MNVYLAGFNVDTQVLRDLEKKTGKREDLTPEVLSAAYARISRDPRPIDQIRQSAREEVEKTRKSNSTIIFKMGHHSVAEHAVFNFDILGLSRYAMEELEKFRLCSYTEKSQRYITLDNDYVMPEEIKGTKYEQMFKDTIALQNKAYFELLDKLKKYVFQKHAKLAVDQKNHNLLEGWAKEDARYITSLATQSQVGQTINARNLELLLRRFASHDLSEIKNLGRKLYEQVAEVAPSIVIFHKANDRDQKTYPAIKQAADPLLADLLDKPVYDDQLVKLVEHTPTGDLAVVAALLHSVSGKNYQQCRKIAADLPEFDVKKIFKAAWENLQFYDSMPREFEYANLTYDIVLSSACFGQLKRHRMSTISAQEYDPNLGVTIPEAIKEIEMAVYFQDIVNKTNEVYEQINKEFSLAAPYILTNAHRKRVLMRVNARELYHISRLREDAHAQWDIQNVAGMMAKQAKEAMPFVFECICGKDKYNQVYNDIFGRAPNVVEAELPGTRKIKQ